jgi:hypothetical protein
MHNLEYNLVQLSEVLRLSLEGKETNREVVAEVSGILLCLASASHYEYLPNPELESKNPEIDDSGVRIAGNRIHQIISKLENKKTKIG